MNRIIYLIQKDLLQLKNTKGKKLLDMFLPLIIIWAISWSGSFGVYFNDLWMSDDLVLFIIVVCSLIGLGILSINRDIRDGLYEQFHLICQLKHYHIFISKFIINFLFIFILILLLNYAVNPINIFFGGVGYHININLLLLFRVILLVSIFTASSFIINLYLKSEQNITIIYFLPIGFGVVYKVLELFSLNTQVWVYSTLLLLNVILIYIAFRNLSNAKLIRKSL